MAEGFHGFRYHKAEAEDAVERPSFRGARGEPAVGSDIDPGFGNDEAAARYHLSKLLGTDDRPAVRGVSAPEQAELVPAFRLTDVQNFPQTGTRLVRFQQMHAKVPIFGSRAVCELDQDRALVSAQGEIAEMDDVSPVPSLLPQDAARRIESFAGGAPGSTGEWQPPELKFFQNPADQTWHLVYHFQNIPLAPKDYMVGSRGHGLGASPRTLRPRVDYLVDAHDGAIVYYYSATPLLDIPVELSGTDEEDAPVKFWGRRQGDSFELRDPLRDITTYDLNLEDMDRATLVSPVLSDLAALGQESRAVVSAHVNASKVFNFYKGVLYRDGINDLGMELVNVVNCTYSSDEPPPTWRNACWYDNRMWYGQAAGPEGRLVSFARFLDIIAHELTHGVTEYTAGLIYRDQSGALNESFSDIFGIIVKNWDATREDGGDADTWDWEMGSGLGDAGLPLRDFHDPSRTGDPAHMDHYYLGPGDSGGVHINSNIHNQAAYGVLTAKDQAGDRMFSPREVSYLYYLCLTRLSPMATFSQALANLVSVAETYFGGDGVVMSAKVAAIRLAYERAGIIEE